VKTSIVIGFGLAIVKAFDYDNLIQLPLEAVRGNALPELSGGLDVSMSHERALEQLEQ
jgi:hypothetical protein